MSVKAQPLLHQNYLLYICYTGVYLHCPVSEQQESVVHLFSSFTLRESKHKILQHIYRSYKDSYLSSQFTLSNRQTWIGQHLSVVQASLSLQTIHSWVHPVAATILCTYNMIVTGNLFIGASSIAITSINSTFVVIVKILWSIVATTIDRFTFIIGTSIIVTLKLLQKFHNQL
jgi:hypothetical protein